MRTCFSSPSEVAHLWAHQLQDEARYSGGNFYFHGKCEPYEYMVFP